MPETAADKKQTRLKILEADEIETVYGLPVFDDEDRAFYFSLLPPERAILSQLHSLKSSIYYILQLGYFKARRQFFVFNLQQVVADAQYVQRIYFPDYTLVDLDITKVTRLKHQGFILELLQYRVCGKEERRQMRIKAQQLAQISSRPIYVFRELMAYLTRQRLIAPGYTVMQEMIGDVLQREKERLIDIAKSHLTDDAVTALDNLLANPRGLYEITRIKREPKDFSIKEINEEIWRGEKIKPLYAVAQAVLPRLDISNESIKYYASLINYYSVFQMSQLGENLAHIYLLCFVQHRYQRLHDNLINCFIYRVRQLLDEAKSVAKERVYEYRLEHNRNLYKAGQVLKLFADDTIADETPFADVRTKAFAILTESKLVGVTDHILQTARLDEQLFQWEYIDQIANRFKRRLRPLLRTIDFSATAANKPLMTAVRFLKTALQKEKPLTQYKSDKLPRRFITEKNSRYLYTTDDAGENQLRVDRYEFLIYRLLRNNLDSGDVFCRHSVRFRSFEDDLLSDEQWQEKDALIAQVGLPILTQTAEEHLAELRELLETRLKRVNQRIASGENGHIEIKRGGRWHLPYSRVDEDVNDPFFESLAQVDIQAVFQFVNWHCRFMNEFTHVLHRYAGRQTDTRTLIACILAWGTNMGLGRMSQTSDIGYQDLATTSNNFIRLETLQKANDVVANAIAHLPIFQHYHIGDTIHSSSDGQKFETLLHTINARYSPKYFGLMKGIVAYTLVANHIPVSARIIGANEHESHYVFDLLYNNPTDIQPAVHSTDTHGANEVNFGILNFFGYQFAPRYRDLYDKVNQVLYGFLHPSQYELDWLLRPIRKINEKLIIEEWENMQRIIVSLALKTTTQSIIIGKLSAFARRNRTKRALWEYDNIIRSLYLLEYIDSISLRRHVQKALNRGESYHKLHKAVSYANFGKLRFKTEGEQQIWNECGRLIANCIIFHNAAILSNVLRYQVDRGDAVAAASLEQISPVAWQHINFHGRYEFTKSVQPIDMEAIVQELVARAGSKHSTR
ncbi:MAG: Tn3 family transposase [Planctomycetota bacterium]|jgi:TnpA family transposase